MLRFSPVAFVVQGGKRMAYVKEELKELDVMNNFLFNRLTTDPKVAEKVCRRLLKSLIGKDVGKIIVNAEQIVMPEKPDKRGVRLDVKIDEYQNETITNVYDIEPHRDKENFYPKKIRYTQAQLDKNSMKSGSKDFSKLPELYIICITNYDPYGYDYMMYTIDNKCVEVPELVYDDGVKIIYFNTKGTKGGSKELKAFLQYLEESTKENVVDEDTQEMDEYVAYIKGEERIEEDYMTVGDWVDSIVEEAVEEVTEEKNAIIAAKDTEIADKNAEIAKLKSDEQIKLINQIIKKVNKEKALDVIADELEEDVETISPIYDVVVANPGKNAEEIYDILNVDSQD